MLKEMQALKFFLVLSSGVVGIGAPAVYGSHELTKETIWKRVSIDALPEGTSVHETAWTNLMKKLGSRNDVKTIELVAIKDNASTDTTGKSLKKWCFTSYKKIYKSLIMGRNSDLLFDVRMSCRISIEEQLPEEEKLNFEQEVQEELKAHLDSLKKHNETSSDLKLDFQLQELHQKLNEESDDQDENWEKLKNWCRTAYEGSYRGDSENEWKLVKAYCIKKKQAE